jgi:uncharacterized protein YyaL (SSP411 family)
MNRLAEETSPYLRQHADNPVDWYPWGDDAFQAARAEGKPILLSVGYSSCHWCHVMAHESFEDPETAAVMNRLFVNVKVDREQRPDVDAIYMQAVQAMTGHGGWPMTVFLDHDGRPFYGGTYFPNVDRQGMPGFVRVMEAIHEAWSERRDEIDEQAEQLRAAIDRTTRIGVGTVDGGDGDGAGGAGLSPAIVERAVARATSQFDRRFGGFGRAPKFPQAMTHDFLLRAHARNPSDEVLEVVTVSLDAMAAGGMYDQVGGGFHRYSVDDFWLVPHFEKMLYDQALLTGAYLRGHLTTGEPRYRRVVEDTIEYVLRDLRHPEGGFFSAEDADSEGVEGKFYLWSRDEVAEIAGDDANEVIRYFGITDGGNFEDPHTGYRGTILHVVDRTEDRPDGVRRVIPRLLEVRAQRVRPGLDDKVLLAWNALFLRSLVEAAAAFGRHDWMHAAHENIAFLLASMRRDDGRLLRSWQDGRAGILAFAEDYAALLEALLTLAELDDVEWLREARHIADEMLALFADDAQGGVYTTGVDAEALIVRPKDYQDNATPSENSMAANALLRLSALTGEASYAEAADRWLGALAPVLADHPTAFAYLLGALDRAVHPSIEVAVVADPSDPAAAALVREVTSRVVPGSVLLSAAPSVGTELSPLLQHRDMVDGKPTAYVCRDYSCDLPVTEPSELRAQLDAALRNA